jgi:NADH-quinone oxidoreductase subunit M
MTKMGGFAHRMPGIAAFFAIAGLSSLGLPGLAGFVAELLVFLGAWTSAHPWWLIPGVLGAFITALYVLRAVRTIFLGPAPTGHAELRDARGVEWASFVILSGTLVALGLWPRLIMGPLNAGVTDVLKRLGQ